MSEPQDLCGYAVEPVDADLALFGAVYETWAMGPPEAPVCAACDAPTGTTLTRDGEMLCAGCHQWAQALTGELEHHISMPAHELGTETGAALEKALRILLTTPSLPMVG